MDEFVQGLSGASENLRTLQSDLHGLQSKARDDPSLLQGDHCRQAHAVLRDIRTTLSELDVSVSELSAQLYDEQVP